MSYQLNEESFLKDVEEHQMIVIREDGIHRHIRFKKPGTGCMHFDLVTWPGYLAYSGDMGCYVFSRLEDMFEFFRTDRQLRDGKTLAINLGYWSEKLRAVDGSRREASAMEFDEETFKRVINEYRVEWMRNGGLSKDDRRELWEAVDREVLGELDNGGMRAQIAAHDFHYRVGKKDFYFQDLFEHNFQTYTHHFIWCCYALAWGIKKFDEANASQVAA
jgi:hypothetical protein